MLTKQSLRRVVRAAAVVMVLAGVPAASFAGIFISVGFAPPALPVYTQPICPAEGYIWTPGYWQYGDEGYFWVPGVWVEAPQPGLLWTPGYWGWGGNAFGWHAGYWGQTVGFYGGVNYGFGYGGLGYQGGRWDGGHFAYNTAVNNVNVTNIHNTYNQTVIVNNTTINNNHTSYNGGQGGIQAQATPQQMAAARQPHVQPTQTQQEHVTNASTNRGQLASVNGGHPAMAAQPRVGDRANFTQARGASPTNVAQVRGAAPVPPAAQLRQQNANARPSNQPANSGQPNRLAQQEGRPAQPQARPQVQPQARPQVQQARPQQQQSRPQQQQARPQAQPRQAQPRQAQPHNEPQSGNHHEH